MTSKSIAQRNKKNAQHSTGPRTKGGKARASQNALKHGASGKPDPGVVTKYLAVILETPEISLEEYFPSDERGYYALQLASAEARLVKAQTALQSFAAGTPEPTVWGEEVGNLKDLMFKSFMEGDNSAKEVRIFRSIMKRLNREEAHETKLGGKRHRLLKRYLREAQTGRSRALKRWIEVNENAA